ncbi:uncharacterized protein LOC117300321 isoform X1 [Asterias rubens]|uniref:uncharacterized protein LOC117300321 isoform X1 n=1 Tax=Asterias rubens TaxID=7604 RepID=UPI001454FCC2|nr:uncharacterized protein LOC117300321 isoform X1 [Asterias rubens]
MSYQQAYRYWQHERTSMAPEASYQQRLSDNHPNPNPNPNLTPSQQYPTYSGPHHVNLTGAHQAIDMYDSLFPTESSAVMRNTAEGKDNQSDYPGWTSTHQRLPMGVTTSEALRNQGMSSLHDGCQPVMTQIMAQPTHYTHHMQPEPTTHSTCHQPMHQTVWAQQSLSHPQLPSLHPNNQQLLLSTQENEPQQNVCEPTAPSAQYYSSSSIVTHPVYRKPLGEKVANEVRSEEGANNGGVILSGDRNCDTPNKTQENGCHYCKLCDVECSGPLNLKMHLKGAKHKRNLQTKDPSCNQGAVGACKKRSKRNGLRRGGFVPLCHNQKDRPIIGLDFVTRVVSPDANDDTYECSLCDISDISRRRIYLHVMAKTHRQAYIKKLKPDLAEQYCTVEDVYKQNEKLQKRESVDLAVLLNSIIKIAAKRDGPGQTNIRLSSERESDVEDEQQDDMMDDVEIPFASPPDSQTDEASSPDTPSMDDATPSNTSQPSAQLTYQSKATFQPSKKSTEATPPPSQAFSFEVVAPNLQTSSSDIPDVLTSKQPSMGVGQFQQDASISNDKQSTSMRHSNVSKTMPSTAFSQVSPMPLPTCLTNDQLRHYCSDVFIAQEHQRRFGDIMMPLSNYLRSSGSNIGISKVFSGGSRSGDTLLNTLSDPEVISEEDAALATDLTRALSQATFKYRLKQKNFTGLEIQGKK